MIQMIITQNGFWRKWRTTYLHILRTCFHNKDCDEGKSPHFKGITCQNKLVTIWFLNPTLVATLNRLVYPINPVTIHGVFVACAFVLVDASLGALDQEGLGKCRRAVPRNIVSQGSPCQSRSPHGPAHHRGLFSTLFLKKQQRVKLNSSLRSLPMFAITVSPSGNIITHYISQAAHILKRRVFWYTTDNFQTQQTNLVQLKWKEMEVKWSVSSLNTVIWIIHTWTHGGTLCDVRCVSF